MELIAASLTLAAVAVTIAALALPLIRTGRAADTATPADDLSDLGRMREERNTALTAIMDLDDELARGNISAFEHRAARLPAVRRAAALIREIEGREQVLDEEIESAVWLRRKRSAESAPANSEADPPL